MRTLLRTRIRPMSSDDLAQVADIERESFTSMWPQTAYRRELQNKLAHYLVLGEVRDEGEGTPGPGGLRSAIRRLVAGEGTGGGEYLLGFIGVWIMVGEAHIVTVAVREQYRRMGIGERLLIAALELSREYGQEVVTLEVRKSNDAAQQLYLKYGFERVGLRVRYYTDNNEDAVIMTTPELLSPAFERRVGELASLHRERYPDLWG